MCRFDLVALRPSLGKDGFVRLEPKENCKQSDLLMIRRACFSNPSCFWGTCVVCAATIAAMLPFNLSAKDAALPTKTGASVSSLPVSDLPDPVLDLRAGLGICDSFAALPSRDHVEVVDDAASFSQMFIVPCSGGGYNLSYVVFVESAGDMVVQSFDTYSASDGWSTSQEVFNAEWNGVLRELSTFRKGSSLGNCGAIGKWRYEFGTLSLSAYLFQADCDSRVLPDQFPLVRKGP